MDQWSAVHHAFVVEHIFFQTSVRGGPQAVSEEKALQKLHKDTYKMKNAHRILC
jgi:hypothetical protein